MRSDTLEAAFLATRYRIVTPEGTFDLRIGIPNPGFDEYLHRYGISCWGIVTAYNPGGVKCDEGNERRHAFLLERLREYGWSYCLAYNHADEGDWPDEPGVLLFQVSEKEVKRLAEDFSQRACVYGENDSAGSIPRLVWV